MGSFSSLNETVSMCMIIARRSVIYLVWEVHLKTGEVEVSWASRLPLKAYGAATFVVALSGKRSSSNSMDAL